MKHNEVINKSKLILLFSSIRFQGTKWCGTGDIAATFSDLGN